jgi:hypothetical protein
VSAIIDKFIRISEDVGLEIPVNAYHVFATWNGRDVIECLQHAHPRHELAAEKREELLPLFIRRYELVWGDGFRRAQHN